MQKKKTRMGRPPKVIGKLTRSINLKLSEMDYVDLLTKAERLNLTPTAYARQMAMNGCVKSPFTSDELGLLRHLAGVTNNLNQYVKHLNSGEFRYKLQVQSIVSAMREILDDSKKY